MKFKSFLLVTSFFFCLAVSVYSQSPTPTPENEDILKISTNLIQIDVTVTDKKGKIVSDLKPEDFEIYENGKKQEMTNFSFMNMPAGNNLQETGKEELPKEKKKYSLPPPPVKLKAEQVRRTYALVVDDLGLSFSSVFWVKESLKKFINEQMQAGDLVAIIRTGSGIGALQSFTSDKRMLLASIEKLRWNSQGRVGINSFDPITTSLKEELNGKKGSDGSVKKVEGIEQDNAFDKQLTEYRQESFSVGTLGALSYVIKGMSELPGRKSVLLFSEGFRLFNANDFNPNLKTPNRTLEMMRVLADQANRSSVVFYTLDPRGLVAPGATAEDDIPNLDAAFGKLRDRENLLRDSQDSLRFLAEETGGVAFINQNNLSRGLEKAVNDQSGYYLIGYSPDDETFDPKKLKFNKLAIKVNRPDVKVRYRSGFFGISDEKINEVKANRTPQRKLMDALVSPFGTNGINVSLYTLFYNTAKNGNIARSLLYIDPKDLKFTLDADGIYRAKFDIIAALFDANGAAATNEISTHSLQFTKERFAAIQEKGILYDLPVTLSKTGAYQFRIALRDLATDKIGSASQFVEIPNLNKKHLTLSKLLVNNLSVTDWKKAIATGNYAPDSDNGVLLDTAVREFKRGTILTYFCEIYNAKSVPNSQPQLEAQVRLFREGNLLLEGTPSKITLDTQTDLQRIPLSSAITLGTDLQPGSYTLQLVVYDKPAKEKRQISAQSIDFDIVQ